MPCPTTDNHKPNCAFCVHYVCDKQFHTFVMKDPPFWTSMLTLCILFLVFDLYWSTLSCELSRIHPEYLLQVLLPEMWGAFGRVPRGVACVTTSTTVCVLNTFRCVLDVRRRVTCAYCPITEQQMCYLSSICLLHLLLRDILSTKTILKYENISIKYP